jgi:hypothetical protein
MLPGSSISYAPYQQNDELRRKQQGIFNGKSFIVAPQMVSMPAGVLATICDLRLILALSA